MNIIIDANYNSFSQIFSLMHLVGKCDELINIFTIFNPFFIFFRLHG